MNDYEFFQTIRICPDCTKTPLGKDEKRCPECRAKNALRIAHQRENPNVRLIMNARCSVSNKKRRERLKEQGICTVCGKRKSAWNRTKCEICLDKCRKYYIKKELING